MSNSRVWQLAGLLLLALALAYGLREVGAGIRARDSRDVVTVTGSAKQRVSSDYVIWDASVSAQEASPAAAAKRLAGWTAMIRTFLLRSGVRPSELVVAPIATNTVTATTNNGSNGTIVGYQLTRSFELRSSRLDEVTHTIEASSQLVQQGIPLAAQPPQFIYTRLADLRPALSAAATRDAIRRARTVVAISGQHLGKLRAIDVGPFQLTAPGSTDTSGGGLYDTTTREKDVTSVVNVTFSIT